MEHVKKFLQNTTTEWTPHIVQDASHLRLVCLSCQEEGRRCRKRPTLMNWCFTQLLPYSVAVRARGCTSWRDPDIFPRWWWLHFAPLLQHAIMKVSNLAPTKAPTKFHNHLMAWVGHATNYNSAICLNFCLDQSVSRKYNVRRPHSWWDQSVWQKIYPKRFDSIFWSHQVWASWKLPNQPSVRLLPH